MLAVVPKQALKGNAPMVGNTFVTRQAATLAGLGYDTVDYWATTGFLKPSIADSEGCNKRRAYSFADILALRVAADLRQTGVSLQSLRRVVDYLKERGIKEPALASVYLVSDGTDVYECAADELQSVLQRPGQRTFRFVIDLAQTENLLREDIKSLAA
jgi:DNA-binding transcriptional MerR regulator